MVLKIENIFHKFLTLRAIICTMSSNCVLQSPSYSTVYFGVNVMANKTHSDSDLI